MCVLIPTEVGGISEPTEACDWWSFGSLLYELLTGTVSSYSGWGTLVGVTEHRMGWAWSNGPLLGWRPPGSLRPGPWVNVLPPQATRDLGSHSHPGHRHTEHPCHASG